MTGPQLLETVAGKEGVTFFRRGGGCKFHIKNRLKFEIFNDKKFISKSLLKDKMVLRMKNFNILRVHRRIRLLGGGVHERAI